MARTYNTWATDAESVNDSSQTTYLYKDFSLFFTPNPVTSDVTNVTDVQDIKRSVRNLILTEAWERPFHPEIASGVRELLFENFTPVSIANIKNKIRSILETYEPRANVTGIFVDDPSGQNMDNNTVNLKVFFTLQNAPNTEEQVDVMLERIR